MTRIDQERNGRPGPTEQGGAPEAERPIERVRPVRVPGAVAGGRRPDPQPQGEGPANSAARVTGHRQPVRPRVRPADGESSPRRRRLLLGLLVAGMAIAAVVAILAAGDEERSAGTPPPLDRTPPTRNAAGFVPLTAGTGAGPARAAARLTGRSGALKLTIHANVPGRSYLVGLVGPDAVKGLTGAPSGRARQTVSMNWRDLAGYDRLAVYAGTPVPVAGSPSSPTEMQPAAPIPHRIPILSISVDRLVRASGVHVAG
jgi:hypothetical protein